MPQVLENNKIVKVDYKKGISYARIPTDKNGWADAKKYLPEDYDLCDLKIKDRKPIKGWSSGMNWDGRRLKYDDEVLYWKKVKGE